MTNFLIYLLFTLTPLLVSPFSSELFELPKTYFLYLITGFLLLSHLKGYLQKKHPIFIFHPLTPWLLIFFASQIFSFIFSFDKYSSFYGYYGRFNGGILTLLCYLIIFFILHVQISFQPKLLPNLLISLLITSQLVILYALAQHFGIDKHYWDQDVQARVFSTFGQPNWLAAYLCVIFFLALHKSDSDLRQNDKSNKHVIPSLSRNLQLTFLQMTTLLALFFTKSQSGFYAFIISFSLYLLAKIITKTFSKHLFFLSCFFLLLCVILENPLKNKLFPAPVLPIPNPTGEEIVITASSDIRKIVWPGAIALGLKFPLFGTGPETFAQTYYWVRPASHNLTSEWNFLYNKAHNEFLNYLANTGFFGLLSYLLLILFTSLLLLKNHSFELLAGFLTILITNFFGFSTIYLQILFFSVVLFSGTENKTTQLRYGGAGPTLLTIPLILFSFFLLYTSFTHYLSDIYFTRQNYLSALKFSTKNPYFQIYSALQLSQQASKEKNKDLSIQSDALAKLALKTSPSEINYLKLQSQVYTNLAQVDLLKYYPLAISSLTKATILAPTDASSFYQLGNLYSAAQLQTEALKNLEKAVELKPNYDHAWFRLGQIYFEQKNYSNAKLDMEAALKINPNNLEAKDYLQRLNSLKTTR